MINTSSIQFYCRDSKKGKNGLAPIEMSININQKRVFIQLPMKCEPSKFSSKRRAKEIDDYLSLMRVRVNQIMVAMAEHQEALTADRIKSYIRFGGYQSYTIERMFTDYLDILNGRVGVNLTQCVYRRYELLHEMFKDNFDTSVEINNLTQGICLRFRDILLQRYDNNTALGYLTKFKSFVRYAINEGRLKSNPIAYVKISKVSKPIDYLDENELNTLINTRLDNASLQNVLDIFLLECASGISYADIVLLEKDDYKVDDNGVYYVNKNRKKTGSEFITPILGFGVDILKRRDFNLNIISNQKMNAYLKVIGDIVGIDRKRHPKSLRTHIARHTFLSYMLNHKIRIEVCSKMAGHKDIRVTQQFYAELTKQSVLDEVASVAAVAR